jgi:nucleoid-associated protein YgaU
MEDMKKSTIMNQINQAEEAGDEEGQAYWEGPLADYQENRKEPSGNLQVYRVKYGDNLFSIAKEIYDDTRYAIKIARANKGIYQITPGMKLRLP